MNTTVQLHQKEVLGPAQYRPSPVKFTSERPEQFPVKPKAERLPPRESNQSKFDSSHSVGTPTIDEDPGSTETQRSMLSLETLRGFTDFGKEEVIFSILAVWNDTCTLSDTWTFD